MMMSLSLRERRLIAILILFAMMAFAWFIIIAPIASGFTARAEERVRLSQTFAANERLIASLPRLRAQAERLKLGDARFHIAAPNAGAAAEILKERMADQITAAGAELKSMQDVAGRPGWVSAWAECRLTLPQLLGLLEKLQNDPPYLVITTLTISADRATQSGKLDALDVRIEAAGTYNISNAR